MDSSSATTAREPRIIIVGGGFGGLAAARALEKASARVLRSVSPTRLWLGYTDLQAFDKDRRVSSVPDLFTVDLVSRCIAWKLAQSVETGSSAIVMNQVTHEPVQESA
jgi:hypothetical protein